MIPVMNYNLLVEILQDLLDMGKISEDNLNQFPIDSDDPIIQLQELLRLYTRSLLLPRKNPSNLKRKILFYLSFFKQQLIKLMTLDDFYDLIEELLLYYFRLELLLIAKFGKQVQTPEEFNDEVTRTSDKILTILKTYLNNSEKHILKMLLKISRKHRDKKSCGVMRILYCEVLNIYPLNYLYTETLSRKHIVLMKLNEHIPEEFILCANIKTINTQCYCDHIGDLIFSVSNGKALRFQNNVFSLFSAIPSLVHRENSDKTVICNVDVSPLDVVDDVPENEISKNFLLSNELVSLNQMHYNFEKFKELQSINKFLAVKAIERKPFVVFRKIKPIVSFELSENSTSTEEKKTTVAKKRKEKIIRTVTCDKLHISSDESICKSDDSFERTATFDVFLNSSDESFTTSKSVDIVKKKSNKKTKSSHISDNSTISEENITSSKSDDIVLNESNKKTESSDTSDNCTISEENNTSPKSDDTVLNKSKKKTVSFDLSDNSTPIKNHTRTEENNSPSKSDDTVLNGPTKKIQPTATFNLPDNQSPEQFLLVPSMLMQMHLFNMYVRSSWAFFYHRMGHFMVYNYENVVEQISIETMLKDDDILSKCLEKDVKVLRSLTNTLTLKKLFQMILTEDNGLDFHETNKLFQIVCVIVPMVRAFVAENLMDTLNRFIISDVEHLDPILASRYSRIMTLLVVKNGDENLTTYRTQLGTVLNYVLNTHLLNALLYHIETAAIKDLLLVLMTQVNINQRTITFLNSQLLIESLVYLMSPKCTEESNENAAELLYEFSQIASVNRRTQEKTQKPDVLLAVLELPSTIGTLLRTILAKPRRVGSLVGGIKLLCGILSYEKSDIPRFNYPKSYNPDPFRILPAQKYLELRHIQTVAAPLVTSRLSDFHNALLNPPKKSPIPSMDGPVNAPIGMVRFEIVKLLVILIQIGNNETIEKLMKLKTMNFLLDLFFKHPLNNLFQMQVHNCILAAFQTHSSCNPKKASLAVHLLIDCKLVERIDNAFSKANPLSHKMCPENMGPLIKIANIVAEYCQSKNPLGKLLRNRSTRSVTMLEHLKRNKLGDIVMLYLTPWMGSDDDDDDDQNKENDGDSKQTPIRKK